MDTLASMLALVLLRAEQTTSLYKREMFLKRTEELETQLFLSLKLKRSESN